MEELKRIIHDNNMVGRPEYYSGRGANTGDLNSKMLEGIYQGILKEFGKSAANNYVKMVADIKVLSATTFLQELYELFYKNWKYTKKKVHAPGIAVPKKENGEYDLDMGMFGVISALSNGSRDMTPYVRDEFLHMHKIKTSAPIFFAPSNYDLSKYYNEWDT